MRYTYQHQHGVWIDLHQPTSEEIEELRAQYDIPLEVASELNSDSSFSRVELHGRAIFCVFHFPAYQHSHTEGKSQQQLNFFLAPEVIITSHTDTIDAVHKFSKMMETESILEKGQSFDSTDSVFTALLKKMYKSVHHEANYISSWLDTVEDNIFRHREREMVFSLSRISRRLLGIQKMIRNHQELLESVRLAGQESFDRNFAYRMDQVIDQYRKVKHEVETHQALADELRKTNNSLLSTKQNETMRQLTALAFVVFPLTFIAAIFGMRVSHAPVVGMPYDFWVIIGLMLALALLTFAVLRYKRWL